MKAYQICNRCVMDTTDIDIFFDEAGNCNHCNEFLQKRIHYKYQGQQSDIALQKLVEKIKKDSLRKPYDCVVGLSGGIDSSYVAYVCKKLGLRTLAVHLDNGWNSKEAVLNIKNIVNKLEIDYESYVLDWEEFKDIQLAFLKASVPEAETPTDVAILGALHRIAAKYGIKYIISGGNFATEGILPKTWHYNAKDTTYFNHIVKKFGTREIKNFPNFGYQTEIYYKLVKGIKMIYLLNYLPYDKNHAIKLLNDELNWQYYGGKHYESNYTGFIQSYYLYHKFNIDYRRATFSSQICTNDLTREEAMRILKDVPYNQEKVKIEKEYIARKLGITLDEFEQILNLPAKYYRDYPNDEKKLNFIYNIYRRLFNKEKLANF